MRIDFNIKIYKELLEALIFQGFKFYTVTDYFTSRLPRLNGLSIEENELTDERLIVLRQDVDRLPGNSCEVARMQKELGIKSTFYFRSVPQSFDPEVIEEIAGIGHEVGYHYEDLSLTAKSSKFQVSSFKFRKKDLIEESIVKFTTNLEKLRKYADVKTICMHGSPLSRWDSRLLWKYYNYRELGVECEPYFDVDFSEMLYLTDTGRKWNGGKVSVRDKAWNTDTPYIRSGSFRRRDEENERLREKDKSSLSKTLDDRFAGWTRRPIPGSLMNMTLESSGFQARYNFRSTNDIIMAAEKGILPDKMMMTFHSQRWTDSLFPWMKELVWQNTKNVVKYFLIYFRNK